MSASPIARQATGHLCIPAATRKVVVDHEHEMPPDYGTTPGGTAFAHTPGGTRIVYERAFLKQLRNSPLARSPPPNLPCIPGVTLSSSPAEKSFAKSKDGGGGHRSSSGSPSGFQAVKEDKKGNDDHQFPLDI